MPDDLGKLVESNLRNTLLERQNFSALTQKIVFYSLVTRFFSKYFTVI